METPWHILLVDDEKDITTVLKDYLEDSLPGLEVVVAHDAKAAKAALRGAPMSLILSDFRMPGEDGIQFLKEARSLAPGVPRALMTAFGDFEVAQRAVNEAKVRAFLPKPTDPDKLLALVREARPAAA